LERGGKLGQNVGVGTGAEDLSFKPKPERGGLRLLAAKSQGGEWGRGEGGGSQTACVGRGWVIRYGNVKELWAKFHDVVQSKLDFLLTNPTDLQRVGKLRLDI